MSVVNVGIIGCGNISNVYFEAGNKFEIFDIVACADLIPERAEAKASEFNNIEPRSVEAIMEDPAIEIIVNLTIPGAHADIASSALLNGKSVYTEKPMAICKEDGKKLLDLAITAPGLIGGAPDTFMGAGIQTCRKLIDDGWIGKPVAATGFMLSPGHERWHPDPGFFYQEGGGPMLDMGPYYITALINLMGPVVRLTGGTQISFPERIVRSQPLYGKKITVDVPTHVAGILEFKEGAIGTIITSFDVWHHEMPRIEIYGTDGSISVPDPNSFGGPVKLRRAGAETWNEMPLSHNYDEQSRGLGVADMAYALRSGRPHRANGKLTYHVLDIMESIHQSAKLGQHITLESTCTRPEPLPLGLAPYTLDL
tara:strand:- start:100696 stop:101799 length:1104 start_codon:yes stop_codon:yes gene_type:complete